MKRYSLFDSGFYDALHTENVRLRVNPAVKDGAGVLLHEAYFDDPPKNWEPRYDNSYPNVIYDPKARLFRLYYTLFLSDSCSEQTPPEARRHAHYRPARDRVVGLCYAESADGLHFVKPALGLVEWRGSRENNILMVYAHGTGALLDEAEPDPGRRYKLVTKYDVPGGVTYMASAFSADGVHWSELIPWIGPNPPADSHNFPFRDPADGRYRVITRLLKNRIRVSAMCESDDFVHWSKPAEILRGSGLSDQVYSMPVFALGDYTIGLPSMYHAGDASLPAFDCVDCELAYAARDGDFERMAPGQAFLPRGAGRYPDGAPDCGCIYAAPPIELDGRLVFYYMGGNGRHTDFREGSLLRASADADRLAHMEQRDPAADGRIVSTRFVLGQGAIRVLADVEAGGTLSASLTRNYGEPLAGYSEADCALVPEADGWYALRADTDALAGETVTLELRFSKARLYAVEGPFTPKNPGYRIDLETAFAE